MKKRIIRCWLSLLLVISMFLSGAVGIQGMQTVSAADTAATQKGEMKVHFLDVDQGLSILVQSEGKTMIYDGGDRKTSSFVVSYLKKQNVKTIDYLISSHYDADHMAGLIGCLKAFEVKHVISSDYEHTSKLYKSFVKAVKADGLKMEHPAVGKTFTFGSGKFTILAPSTIDKKGSNNNSVAIKLENGDNSFVFTGDAEHASESAMCNTGIDLECDVLVPGHHGSATATSWDFLQKTVPEYAVISCGKDNKYGHPDKDTMDKLESMDIQVYRTDKQGTITVTSDGKTLKWSADSCNDYTPGDENDTGTKASDSAESKQNETSQSSAGASQTQGTQDQSSQTVSAAASSQSQNNTTDMVWISATGSKYHRINNCGRMNPDNAKQVTREQAVSMGLEACKKCY